MRPILIPALLALMPATATDLDTFLKNLSVEARMDRDGFAARVATQFKVGQVDVRAVLSTVKDPADAFMVFQLGQLSRQPHDRVLAVYKAHHGKGGWGAMAKELGIKPGSPAFHALKRGDFRLEGGAAHGGKGAKSHDDHPGKGKGRGHKK